MCSYLKKGGYLYGLKEINIRYGSGCGSGHSGLCGEEVSG